MNKTIYSFWEGNKIPDYLLLCMETWKKFLPDFKIEILNYDAVNNIPELKNKYYPYLYNNFTLPIQADAIRVSLLNLMGGGIWFDMDTIITSEGIRDLLKSDSNLILTSAPDVVANIGFIVAKENSKILQLWENKIMKNLDMHKNYYSKIKKYTRIYDLFNRKFRIKNRLNKYDFLGNFILDSIIRDYVSDEKELKLFNWSDCNVLPEVSYYKNYQVFNNYRDFYFNNDYSDYIFENTKGLIQLHNSWTPDEFKKMDRETFLNQNNTLAKLLKKLNES